MVSFANCFALAEKEKLSLIGKFKQSPFLNVIYILWENIPALQQSGSFCSHIKYFSRGKKMHPFCKSPETIDTESTS